MSAEVEARYRDYAAKCLTIAKCQENEHVRLALIDMAQSWMALAGHAVKNETLFAAYQTSEPKSDGV